MTEKIKAINPEIIVSGDVEKPYYEIKYYNTADNRYHIGFGSIYYANVLKWLKKYFEPIEADEQPVVHGHWIRQDESFTRYKCSNPECGVENCSGFENYCPNCGAKMDGDDCDR